MTVVPHSVLIVGAKLFDGYRFQPRGCLLVLEGRVAALDPRLTPPAGVPVVDARGGTGLPGLIDAHAHVFPGALQSALRSGVTTELDMFADPGLVGALVQQASSDPSAADLRSAGIGATAPGGHPTRLVTQGLLTQFPTVAGPVQAEDFVAARVAEGSHFLKVVLEDGTTTGHPCPTLITDTVEALVGAAHARGLLVVAHALTQAHALLAVGAGVDGLAHLFIDEPPSGQFLDAAVHRLRDPDAHLASCPLGARPRPGPGRRPPPRTGSGCAPAGHAGDGLPSRPRPRGPTWPTPRRPSPGCTGQACGCSPEPMHPARGPPTAPACTTSSTCSCTPGCPRPRLWPPQRVPRPRHSASPTEAASRRECVATSSWSRAIPSTTSLGRGPSSRCGAPETRHALPARE